jgi:hypothetical protein
MSTMPPISDLPVLRRQPPNGMIQAPELKPRIMRDELTDYERTAIRPFLPNRPRGAPRVNDWRVLMGRSRGGLTTKIHACGDTKGLFVASE